jgi:hypothetical protein
VGGNGQTNNVSRLIGGQLIDSGTLYFSYLTKRNNDTLRTTSLSFFGPAVGTTAPANRPERLAIGQIGTAGATDSMTNGNIGLFFNNGPQPAGVVTHLIVGRIDWNAAGNETVTLWVDPADVTSEPVVPYIQTSAFELTSINSIRLFSGNLAAAIVGPPAQPAKPAVSADFDEIRLGTTWDSVIIPEPSALALTLMSAALLGGLRRRQA